MGLRNSCVDSMRHRKRDVSFADRISIRVRSRATLETQSTSILQEFLHQSVICDFQADLDKQFVVRNNSPAIKAKPHPLRWAIWTTNPSRDVTALTFSRSIPSCSLHSVSSDQFPIRSFASTKKEDLVGASIRPAHQG